MFVQPAVVIEGRKQFQVGAGEQSPPLEAGVYDVWAVSDAFIKIATTADDVTAQTGYLIPTGAIIPVRIGRDGFRIGSTAEISVHRVE